MSKGFLITILIIIGIVVIPALYFIRKESIESKNWPMTKGKIIEAKLDYSTTATKLTFCYEPKISYEYNVNGISYTSTDIYIGSYHCGGLEKAQSVLNRYPVGKEVMVFYNPGNPLEAVLERRVSYPFVGYISLEQK